MTTRVKRRIIVAILISLVIWPGLHFALAARLGFDPWELFGWAMYAVPQARYEMAVEGDEAGVVKAFLPAGPLRQVHRDVARKRALLGDLRSLDDYGAQVLASYPRLDAVFIVERRWFLDRETALLDYRDERHHFSR